LLLEDFERGDTVTRNSDLKRVLLEQALQYSLHRAIVFDYENGFHKRLLA
jgi:hypothetical protein